MKKDFVFWWKDYVTMPSPVACVKTLKDFSHLPGCATKDYMMLAINSELRFLISKDNIPDVIEQGKKFLDKEYFVKYMKDLEDVKRRYMQKVDEINSKDIKKLSDEELGKYLLEMIYLIAEGIAYYWGSQYEPLHTTEYKLKSILKKKYKGAELEEIFAMLVTPIELD
ncbi:hypothetical protein KY342_01810, partial [Candidatus Woesearchaeota archaeon]|nr:hypothetical protein [Candidatus Woesearchaeota archaeon]